jgi:hypothetical protein
VVSFWGLAVSFSVWVKSKKCTEKLDLDGHSIKRKGLCCSQRPYRWAIFSNIESKMHYHICSLTNWFYRRNISTVEGFEAELFSAVIQHSPNVVDLLSFCNLALSFFVSLFRFSFLTDLIKMNYTKSMYKCVRKDVFRFGLWVFAQVLWMIISFCFDRKHCHMCWFNFTTICINLYNMIFNIHKYIPQPQPPS